MPSDAPAAEQRQATDAAVRGAPCLTLGGARIARDAFSAMTGDMEIEHGRIRRVVYADGSAGPAARKPSPGVDVDLTGYLLLPGLINAHEHLEFNLFPRLGRGPYKNAQAWAEDIYRPDRSPVREHLEIPKPVRLWWGGIKNLLCGVTTVCHHNEFSADVFEDGFPVRVLKRYAWSHSLALGGNIEATFQGSAPDAPYIIHLGEGTDAAARDEIFELDRRGALSARTVIVHGVALDDAGHDLLRQRGAALVWCPSSNLFTLGATLSPQRTDRNCRTALGSDSALTAGDLLDEIHTAHAVGVSAQQLFDLVTTRASDVLKLENGEGSLQAGSIADVVAIPDRGLSPAATLVRTTFDQIGLVLLAGVPQLLSTRVLAEVPEQLAVGLNRIDIDGVERWIRAPIEHLMKQAVARLGSEVRLAGKRIGA